MSSNISFFSSCSARSNLSKIAFGSATDGSSLELLIFALSLWKSNEAEEANISC
jgi:hypothetical protein